MEQKLTIGESGDWHASLPSDLHATWVRYSTLIATCDLLENQTATREQMSNKQLNLLDIESVRLVEVIALGVPL